MMYVIVCAHINISYILDAASCSICSPGKERRTIYICYHLPPMLRINIHCLLNRAVIKILVTFHFTGWLMWLIVIFSSPKKANLAKGFFSAQLSEFPPLSQQRSVPAMPRALLRVEVCEAPPSRNSQNPSEDLCLGNTPKTWWFQKISFSWGWFSGSILNFTGVGSELRGLGSD